MRDWLSLYRTGGFEALYPRTRADRGQPRRLREKAEAVESSKMLEHLLGDLSRIRQLGRDAKVFEGSDHGGFLGVQANGLS